MAPTRQATGSANSIVKRNTRSTSPKPYSSEQNNHGERDTGSDTEQNHKPRSLNLETDSAEIMFVTLRRSEPVAATLISRAD